ncbi:alanine racemase [candidate division KSB1 bacterium]
MKIKQPSLIIDKEKCLENIRVMASKAKINNVNFRPHFKTHQSAIIGHWFREYNVRAISVSSVNMARYFSDNGWHDITIAFPLNPLEINEINEIAKNISLNILVASDDGIQEYFTRIKVHIGIYIEIDDGYHRSGIPFDQTQKIDKILSKITTYPFLKFKGFLVHSGKTYTAKSKKEIIGICNNTIKILKELKQKYSHHSDIINLSIGDTPSCSLKDKFEEIDEIRPGNFIFYDTMQYYLGSCKLNQIAVALACPVIARYPERNELVIYGGAVHLSKDNITDNNGNNIFGLAVQFDNNKWSEPMEDTWVSSLSQEHGIIRTTSELLKGFKVGDIIGILPVHSCLTANLQPYYLTTEMEVIPKMRKGII